MLRAEQVTLLKKEAEEPFHKIPLNPERSGYEAIGCSDILQLTCIWTQGKLSVSFAAEGCQLSLASASLMCRCVEGLNQEEVIHLIDQVKRSLATSSLIPPFHDLNFLSTFYHKPNRKHCAALCWESLEKELLKL